VRLAVFCNDFWPAIGGVPTATRGLAGALRDRGHDVVVLTRQPGGCETEELVDGIRVRRFDWNLRPYMTFPLRFRRARAAVRGVLDGWSAEAVYSHFVSLHAVYASDTARRARAPLILSFRGNDAMRIASRGPVNRLIYGRLTREAAANLFCSEWLRRESVEARWFRGREQSTGVLADAVAVQQRLPMTEQPAEPFALAAGRMVHKKGFDLLLRAWAVVAQELPLTLWIAGTGPEEGRLRRLAGRLSLHDRVHFLGPVPHDRLLGILERAALCIVPSREEPYGILVVEAQAIGTPVVATRVGNLPALVEHGRTGYLAAPEPRALGLQLVKAWRDDGLPAVAAAARASRAANRGYDDMAAELERWIAGARAQEVRSPGWT
jgi:glycosyltransferase involved in cell wall biosynthesis